MVLRTRSRHEHLVESCLQRKSIKAYLPKHKVTRRWKDRRRVVELPLFPGYVFVQPSADQYADMRYIRGSCGLVLIGNQPATMPEKDLQAVKILVGSGADLKLDMNIVVGQRVKVVSGPFAGAEGELVKVKSQERLVINAHLLGSSVSVEVGRDMVSIG
ncbi:MAG: UpxY family transcription antiterminator [Lysobacter sp.]|nr:UpxY family transcription antiterminator [Lysobacter sp.]